MPVEGAKSCVKSEVIRQCGSGHKFPMQSPWAQKQDGGQKAIKLLLILKLYESKPQFTKNRLSQTPFTMHRKLIKMLRKRSRVLD